MSLALLPAVEQLALLRERKISPLELVEEHIARIERWNPTLNALVHFDPEEARRQARHAVEGPLSGLPVTVKASIATKGYRCEIGSVLHRGQIPQEDAESVARLRRAGAVILGTTNCPEFLMAYETDNLLYGKTNNPWATERTAGGSSGGEAAAIAAGLSAGGLGSDSGGSVREPAHFSGICSLKPTSARIPAVGHLPPCVGPFSILGAIGPMARTVADVDLLFRVAAGRYPSDPSAAPVHLREVSVEEAKHVPIGWFEDDGLIPVTKETRQAVRDAADALERQGFKVKEFRPTFLEEARRLWHVFFVQCGAMFYESSTAGHRNDLSPTFQNFLEIAESEPPLTAKSLLHAWAECDMVRSQLLAEMQEFPLLLMPVSAIPAFRHGERQWTVEGRTLHYFDAMRFTQWFNLLAAPAAVVPVGQSEDGLPIGVQIAGRPYDDELVLKVAAAVESEFGYRPPPLQ
ncbi:amidase [Alloacidobacterium dinghuense]|uniref:Amidase n=1 Tax=Alloacidobacterium dinghuense TaxID=2763107 RepID=A0A7G8BQ62_9BACT|nr:amidase [Alloacidobacterium dinghuense]QNI34682.1 amidase [Alloacidobacterium dinghuense]